jgi:hypothetical protein
MQISVNIIIEILAIKTPGKDKMTIGTSSSSKLMGNLSSKHKYCLSLIKNPKDKYLQ